MWFKKLVGFDEINPEQVRKNIKIQDNKLISLVNNQEYQFGELEIVRKRVLADRVKNFKSSKTSFTEIKANVKDLHLDIKNENALFQVTSQFNLLEMINPDITPEMGIDRYENDFTQGPTCAIACGAGTIYRNYFVEVNGKIGQTKDNQINCIDSVMKGFLDTDYIFKMKNGYLIIKDLERFNQVFSYIGEDLLKDNLKIGIMWNTEVTISPNKHKVSQIYCSAFPISYNQYFSNEVEKFAKLILEATYEATICAGILNYIKTGNNKVFLTFVGGGVFGNKIEWIRDAIDKTLQNYQNSGLDIYLVHKK